GAARRIVGALGPPGGFGAPGLGQLVDAPTVDIVGPHQTLVLEKLEGGVDRARARSPQTLAPVLEASHHVVPVAGRFRQHAEDRGANVAAPPPGWAGWPPARGTPSTPPSWSSHAWFEPCHVPLLSSSAACRTTISRYIAMWVASGAE